MRLLILLAVATVVLVGLAVAYGTNRWGTAERVLVGELEQARRPATPRTYDMAELADLPEPVQRYFRAVLEEGQPIVSALTLEQAGTFNMSETGENWRPFHATQRVITRRPGFDWEARIAMMPGVAAWVRDAYVAGEGILHASLFGLVSLVELRGSHEMAEGELVRFLAEAPWYPTALLPSQGVRWFPIDSSSARAILADGVATADLTVRFGADGLIESVHAAERARTVAGETVRTPWEGRWSRYEERGGMRIPLEGEAAWIHLGGRRPYWRGRLTGIVYEPVPSSGG